MSLPTIGVPPCDRRHFAFLQKVPVQNNYMLATAENEIHPNKSAEQICITSKDVLKLLCPLLDKESLPLSAPF